MFVTPSERVVKYIEMQDVYVYGSKEQQERVLKRMEALWLQFDDNDMAYLALFPHLVSRPNG